MESLHETLNMKLATWQIEVGGLLYKKNGANFYLCKQQRNGCVCIVEIIPTTTDTKKAMHEVELLQTSKHPFAIQVHGHFCLLYQGVNSLCIIFERSEKDLSTELKLRHQAANYWSEEQLWYYARCLIDVLAFMQENEIVHGDISPNSIFLAADGTAKVWYWVNSQEIDETVYTFVQTANFFSPELKRRLFGQQQSAQFDPYKSDVYSLGLIFLTMAYLTYPTGVQDLTTLEVYVEACISQLWYSEDFKNLLRGMLSVNPAQRYSFLELRDWLGIGRYQQQAESLHQRSIPPDIVADDEIVIVDPHQQGLRQRQFPPNVVVPVDVFMQLQEEVSFPSFLQNIGAILRQ